MVLPVEQYPAELEAAKQRIKRLKERHAVRCAQQVCVLCNLQGHVAADFIQNHAELMLPAGDKQLSACGPEGGRAEWRCSGSTGACAERGGAMRRNPVAAARPPAACGQSGCRQEGDLQSCGRNISSMPALRE